MKKKIIKISSITLAVAIMLCGTLMAAAEPDIPPVPVTTANILDIYYGASSTVAPMIVAWYGDNTAYLATTAGLFAIAAIIAIIFGVRRNKKKGGDS